jgi:AraC-like DNA-binding protein
MFAGRPAIPAAPAARVPFPGAPPADPNAGPAADPAAEPTADPAADSSGGAGAGPAPRSTDPPRPLPAFITAGVILDKGRRAPSPRPDTALPDQPAPQHPPPPAPQADRALAARFLALAAARLGDQHSIAELARDLDTTTFHNDRACRNTCGRDALDLIYRLRLERALEMLGDQRLGIAAIAQALGYSGPAHFNRAFAAATGRSPHALRDGLRRATHPRPAD